MTWAGQDTGRDASAGVRHGSLQVQDRSKDIARQMKSAPETRVARTQGERSETMKNRLADAAYQVAVDEGVGALTVRAIVERAGVSQGALLHHFPNKEAIILGTIERTLELARRDSERYLQQPGLDRHALLSAFIDELRGFFFSDRFWVAISITVEYSRRSGFAPHLTERVQALRAPVYEAWAQRFMEAGWAELDARKAVRSGAALVSGLAMRRFWAPADEIADQVLNDWVAATLQVREA